MGSKSSGHIFYRVIFKIVEEDTRFFAVNALFSRTVLLLGPTFLRFIITSTWISWSLLISIFFYSLIHSYLQDVHQKLCFFPIHCNQSPACRRAIHPHKRSECTVTLVGWPIFCTTNSSLVLAMERWQNIEKS